MRCKDSGTSSVSPVAPKMPNNRTTAYALIPLAQPLVNTRGSTDTPAIVTRTEYPYLEGEMSRCADGPGPLRTEEW
ncbi:hypothetical protein GCM10017674_21240 [Streptomyces gardneri]|uniref:Uncharacterized protein n=1 Tax=Streptomyces gardneri TaxID=66892 RepID=A0A4Y3RGF1_9ACTN|nr:hypothetical protein SGA01_23300 [Streptomyces gardneri]GHG92111.1 hypothetical protein GCM10017674_21240 [Streptomyces gardneri]